MAGKDFPPRTSKPFRYQKLTVNSERIIYMVWKTTKIGRITNRYCDGFNLRRDTLRFLYDDLRVRDLQTVVEVGFLCGVGAARLMVSCR